MSIGAVSGGGGLPLEVLQMMNEVGKDLRTEARDAARDEANLALEKGYEEADNMREQAGHMRSGAILGAAFTAGGAALQGYGATKLGTNPELGKSLGELGGTSVKMSDFANGFEQSAGQLDAAGARRAAADAEAANKHAASAQSDADEAQKVMDRSREAYGQIVSLEHASMMAAISGRV